MEQVFTISGTTMTVHLPAELDHHNSEQIRKEADQLIRTKNIRRVLFDFSRTVFMDSSGIGMIIGRYKTMRFMGGMVAAVCVSEQMRRILTLSGIYKVIDIYEGIPQQMHLC
ncbi:STAS domain-containing protein [Parablautia sp. Marseille-Q6255]|uniref:STAS domain-containing protein n=1 Tax=Parablautia sp. Marseille-Q6255 TaxID=3039593 RepID=UPI0024BC343B|nr:anti-sigma factor antagonist [Parablautia sp. Marseille-Q6255]